MEVEISYDYPIGMEPKTRQFEIDVYLFHSVAEDGEEGTCIELMSSRDWSRVIFLGI